MNSPPARLALAAALVLACLALAGCTAGETATTRLEVHFSGQASDIAVDVPADLGSRPTSGRYALDRIPHPDGYTAHDQLQDWADTGGAGYEATAFNSSFGAGYFLTRIGAVAADGATAYWSLAINGQESAVGMSEAILGDGDVVTWTYTAAAEAVQDSDPIGVTVDPPAPTQGETATVTGSVNKDARVSLDGGPSIEAKAGRWSLTTQPLAYGQTATKLRVEDGVHSVVVNVTLVRLASGTFEAKYTAYPMHEDSRDVVWYDPGVLASLAMYDGKAAPRADAFSVHDFMVAWSAQTGRAVEYSYSESFGFGVNKIDGVGQPLDSSAPPYWCYKLDGTSASLGISLQPMEPGAVVTWEYAGCM